MLTGYPLNPKVEYNVVVEQVYLSTYIICTYIDTIDRYAR